MQQVLWPSGFVSIEVKWNGVSLGANFNALDFKGAGVSVLANGATAEVTIPGGGGGAITVQDFQGNQVNGVSLVSFPYALVSPGAPGEALVSGGVQVADNGVNLPAGFWRLNFIGATVTDTGAGSVDVDVSGGGGGLTVQDTLGNVLPGVSLITLGAPGEVGPGAPGEALWTPLTGAPDALVYFDPTGKIASTDAALVAAPLDQFGRPQLRDTRTAGPIGAVWRQGAWTADGDASDVDGDGIVIYGPAGGLHDAANGMFARVKADRFGLRRIIGGVDIGYAFRVDDAEMFLRDDLGAKTFNVDRATGNQVIAGTLEMFGGGAGTEVLYPTPTAPEDRYAAYADSPQMGYASSLRFIGAPRTPTFFVAPKLDDSLGYTVIQFEPQIAAGAGNGILLYSQSAGVGSGLSSGDVGIQCGASDGGAVGGTAFVQPGLSAAAPDYGTSELRNATGAARVSAGGAADGVAFHGTAPIAKPTVTGSRGGNAALASLLTALANYGLITDGTTP